MLYITAFICLYDTNHARKQIDMIYLDVRKAFDSVPHKELLFKLWKMGITDDLWLWWFKNYLTEGSYYVIFKEAISDTCLVLSGVPQGVP